MANKSSIEWTEATWNPVAGCTVISPGCTNCYADRLSTRYGFDVWGPNAKRRTFTDAHWRDPLKWEREAVAKGESALSVM